MGGGVWKKIPLQWSLEKKFQLWTNIVEFEKIVVIEFIDTRGVNAHILLSSVRCHLCLVPEHEDHRHLQYEVLQSTASAQTAPEQLEMLCLFHVCQVSSSY